MTETQTETKTEVKSDPVMRGLAVPEVGQLTTVTLPGEILRAEVIAVKDDNHIWCKIQQPMARSHQYKKDDVIGFHRAVNSLNNRQFWEADV